MTAQSTEGAHERSRAIFVLVVIFASAGYAMSAMLHAGEGQWLAGVVLLIAAVGGLVGRLRGKI
jgi:hypothetical protein